MDQSKIKETNSELIECLKHLKNKNVVLNKNERQKEEDNSGEQGNSLQNILKRTKNKLNEYKQENEKLKTEIQDLKSKIINDLFKINELYKKEILKKDKEYKELEEFTENLRRDYFDLEEKLKQYENINQNQESKNRIFLNYQNNNKNTSKELNKLNNQLPNFLNLGTSQIEAITNKINQVKPNNIQKNYNNIQKKKKFNSPELKIFPRTKIHSNLTQEKNQSNIMGLKIDIRRLDVVPRKLGIKTKKTHQKAIF